MLLLAKLRTLLAQAPARAALAITLPLAFAQVAQAEIKVGQVAPNFTLKTQDGKDFKLSDRKDQGWTVLYFYPKAGTPGCTTQACAFRDAIKVIRAKHAEVYGISADSVDDQKKFHAEHHLAFTLLADPDDKAINAFDAKMQGVNYAKRWTFILDPQLIVRHIDTDVDPAADPQRTASELDKLQKASGK